MDVVGIGNPVCDLAVHIDMWPGTDRSTRIRGRSLQGGGKSATAMATLGRFGVGTGLIGVAGDDENGLFCLEDLADYGVDTSQIVIDRGGRTAFCVVISEGKTHGRTILGDPGMLRALEHTDIDRRYIGSARYLYLQQMDEISNYAASIAKNKNVTVVLDGDFYKSGVEESLKFVDVFIGSEYYYERAYKDVDAQDACRRLQDMGPSTVVFTFGESGCICLSGDDYVKVPAFKVDVKDTTGAGDVFHGAFIYGLINGWDIKQTAVYASAASAIKCTHIGGRAGIPDKESVERFIDANL